MKVKFCCDSGANIHSCRSEVIDTVEDLGLDEGEWEALRDADKLSLVDDWAANRLEIYYEEL